MFVTNQFIVLPVISREGQKTQIFNFYVSVSLNQSIIDNFYKHKFIRVIVQLILTNEIKDN